MNQILIGQYDNNKTFTANLDDLITVSLENAMAGYRQKLEGINEKIIYLEDSKYSIPSGSAIGSSGTRTFNFKPRSLGTTEVHLSLKREWEKEISPIDHFTVFIQIT